MWSRIRHRRLQALALLVLSAVLTSSLCLAPLYQRAMEQALTDSLLDHALPAKRSVSLSTRKTTPNVIAGRLPSSLTAYVAAPVLSSVVPVSAPTATDGQPVVSRLYAPVGVCDHVRVVQGRCPRRAGEILVSVEDGAENGWQVGGTISATQRPDPTYLGLRILAGDLEVVGLYEPVDDGWMGQPQTGRVGLEIVEPPVSYTVTDDWLTGPESLAKDSPWFRPTATVTWPLQRDAVDVDSILRIGPAVQALKEQTLGPGNRRDELVLESDLPLLAQAVDEQRGQARTTVVVLVAQLAVLLGIVLWMVLLSATDDRRPEVALARLRGRGRRGAARYLLMELLPVCLAGVVLGVLAAPTVEGLVGAVVFPGPVPHELPAGLAVTAAVSLVAVGLVVLAAARRAVREPVDSLLRGVPSAAGPATGEVVVVVVSLSAVVLLVTVDLAGPLATLAPTLLSVAVGLLLARWLRPAVLGVGGWLLRRGWAATGAGVISSVRRPAARRVLVMVVVASALVVFCCDALVTGRQNRENAAEQAVGAPYVLTVRPAHLPVLLEALRSVDPSGLRLTPVVTMRPDGSQSSAPTVGVEPRAWARVASFPLMDRDDVPWQDIVAPATPPIRVTGNQLRGRVSFTGVHVDGDPEALDGVHVSLQVRTPSGGATLVKVAPVPGRDRRLRASAFLSCSEGCEITGITLTGVFALSLQATVVLSGLTLDGQPVDLGSPDDWRSSSGGSGSVAPADGADGGLGMVVTTRSGQPPVLLHAWVPDPVPALVTFGGEEDVDGAGLSEAIRLHPAGSIPLVSGSAPTARVVDLDGLLRRPDAYPVVNATVEVWSTDAALIEQASTELHERGIPVDGRNTEAEVRDTLDATPAAWSLALSVLVGLAALLVAALVMLVVTATTWRARAGDLAALRMAGLRMRRLRRLELLGTLPMVLVGCLAGGGCGVVAARLALPDVRQFTEPPEVSTTDFSVPWPVVGLALVGAVALLAGLTLATTAWTARRSRLAQLRQSG